MDIITVERKYILTGIKINFYRLVASWATRKKKVVAQTKSW